MPDKFLHRRKIIFLLVISLLITFASVNSFSQEDEEEFTQDDFSQDSNKTNDPVKLFNKGQAEHEKGNLKEAIKYYEKALEVYPEFPEAAVQLGSAFESLGKITKAESFYRKALQYRPNWTIAMTRLGSLLVNENSLIEAEKLLDKTLEIENNNLLALESLVSLHILKKSDQSKLKALFISVEAITKNKNVPAGIWASKSALERRLGKNAEAEKSLNQALTLDPKNKLALLEKFELSLDKKNYNKAISTAEQILVLYPNLENLKISLAKTYVLSGKNDEALKVISKIRNPNAEVIKLKNSLETVGNNNIESLEKSLEEDKNNVAVLGRLCSLSRVKNPQKALIYCKRASELEPSNIDYAIGFGAALVQQRRYGDAVGLFNKLIKFAPENYTIHANLATALFQMGDFQNAKIEYEWIIKKQPKLAVAYYFLAISHDRLEEYTDALENYEKFLKLADLEQNKLQIEKVNLRLPILKRQIKSGK